MNERANHPRLEMLVGHLLVDKLYLSATLVVEVLTMVVTCLQEAVVAVLQEVMVTDP